MLGPTPKTNINQRFFAKLAVRETFGVASRTVDERKCAEIFHSLSGSTIMIAFASNRRFAAFMIHDYPLSAEPTGKRIGKEIFAMLAAGVMMPFGFHQPRTKTERKKEQRTVVMIHGLGGNHSNLLPLASYLRLQRNAARVLSFNYSASQGIAGAAIALQQYLREHVRGGRIDFVCHSLGGVVARYYLQELGGARRVDHCVTLGTPHRGTYNAYWLPTRVGRELRPDSAVMQQLERTRANAARVKFASVVAGSDTIVVPRVFADHEQVTHFDDLGHVGLLLSPRVWRTVSEALAEAMPGT